MIYRNARLIYNPNARSLQRRGGSIATSVPEILRGQGCDVTLSPTARAGHATTLAREAVESGADLVLAAGGDGTVNEVLNGMAGGAVPLAVLPAGTANVLACELGLPRDPVRAAERLSGLTPRRIALGLLRAAGLPPRYFLLFAGVGLDARIASDVEMAFKRRAGRLAYWWAGFAQLGKPVPEFTVRADGMEVRAGFALASRVRNYGGDLEIAREASLFENRFALVAFEGASAWTYLRYLAGVALNRLPGMRGVALRHARRVEFAGERIPVQVDGELAGHTPAAVEIVPDALTLLVP
ncbi:MAG: diacylglycerol/lipid kinase family protein [Bryobacteraceae bacterium]